MRTRKTIAAVLVVLSLVSGAVGCKSNGGPWYKPNTYAFYNPFNGKDAMDSEGSAHASIKPSLDSQPNVNVPPGGYTSQDDEAKYYAGRTEGNKTVVPQYGTTNFGTTDSRVASTQSPSNPLPNSYLPAETPYSPYGPADGINAVPAAAAYQPTSYYDAAPAVQPPAAYPGTGIQGVNPAAVPYGAAPAAAPQNNYSPYNSAPAVNPAAPAAPASSVPVYGQPVSANNYGVPTATPNNPMPAGTAAPAAFTATPSAYSPNPGF
ncbi:MAG: hypothetical protein LBN39_04175 [Planctomycetaceae bacterium]|jgi:hypothetical protein|nr:hypothetical protein [Planctomycetaceae bacterium]